MKKMIVLAVILTSFSLSAQLNSTATNLKNNYPELYGEIRTFAVDEWGNDHRMVVYTINNQADALVWLSNKANNKNIQVDCMVEWQTELTYNGKPVYDYRMVKYCYEQQMKNINY